LAGYVQQSRVKQAWMQAAMGWKNHAALIRVTCNLAVLLGPWHDLARHADLAAQALSLARVRLIIGCGGAAAEAADAGKFCINALALDKSYCEIERGHPFAQNGLGLRGAITRFELCIRQPMAVSNHSAGPARCAEAGSAGVDHGHRPPGPRERKRARKTRIARADDDNIRRPRQRGAQVPLARRGLPPKGRLLQIVRSGVHGRQWLEIVFLHEICLLGAMQGRFWG
jgi:hypothetical protein